jgi:hypothetical protein
MRSAPPAQLPHVAAASFDRWRSAHGVFSPHAQALTQTDRAQIVSTHGGGHALQFARVKCIVDPHHRRLGRMPFAAEGLVHRPADVARLLIRSLDVNADLTGHALVLVTLDRKHDPAVVGVRSELGLREQKRRGFRICHSFDRLQAQIVRGIPIVYKSVQIGRMRTTNSKPAVAARLLE